MQESKVQARGSCQSTNRDSRMGGSGAQVTCGASLISSRDHRAAAEFRKFTISRWRRTLVIKRLSTPREEVEVGILQPQASDHDLDATRNRALEEQGQDLHSDES